DEPEPRAIAKTMVVGARLRKHLARAQQAKDVDELDMAIGLMQTLPLRDLPGDMAINFYVTLSRAWRDRYDWAGDPADLEKAIAQCLAVRATGQSGVEAAFDHQGDLEGTAHRRYLSTGAGPGIWVASWPWSRPTPGRGQTRAAAARLDPESAGWLRHWPVPAPSARQRWHC